MRQSIVIEGAGFCGNVLAANLLRRPPAMSTAGTELRAHAERLAQHLADRSGLLAHQ